MRSFIHILLTVVLFNGLSVTIGNSNSTSAGFSLRKKLINTTDTTEINKYTRLALSSLSKGKNVKEVKAYIDTAELYCASEKTDLPALLHLARAQYFFLIGDFNNASQEATISMKLASTNNETQVLLKTMNFLGKYSQRTGFFKESIDYYKNIANIAASKKLKGYIPMAFGRQADVYEAMGNTEDLNICLQKQIEASKSENDSANLKLAYYRLGSSLTGENRNYRKADSLEFQDYRVPDSLVFRNFRKADSLLRISLEMALKKKDTLIIILTYANMGWNFYREKRYSSAIIEYNKSLSYSLPANRHNLIANAYGNLGTIYRDMEMIDMSLKYYARSIEQSKMMNEMFSTYWVYLDMSDMYLSKKDTSNAFKNYVQYKKYSDLYLKKFNSQGMDDAKIRFEAETHKNQLELLSLKLRNQRLLIYGYTGLFILSIAIGILIINRSRVNARRKISEMNHKISEMTQANLRQQMNPHFIFNTLNSIQYYMYQHDKLATNNYLTKFSSLMRKVLENSQHTAVALRDELDALNLYLELEKIRFKDKFDYKLKIDDEIDTILYKVPTMLIQPYVENSISHGLMPLTEKGLIKIDIQLKKDYILCIIEDNGVGREVARERKSGTDTTHNSLGTQIVKSRLDLVNTLYGTSLKTIYTDLKNEQGEALGTKVEIHIPIIT